MTFTAPMMMNMTSSSTECTRHTKGKQGRVSVFAITPEDLNDDHEFGRRKVNHSDSWNLLKLISSKGESTVLSVTVRVDTTFIQTDLLLEISQEAARRV
ncbi:hypothetical protein ARMGADRAFT_530578 [Armillaria gallica]|uniref:Uncharacterized protein n=1 Tax=Armillaria gallica TaxID=47427 RepID=A0A2H3DBT9_ARMGA|nr:hypothetical protein ARMGADRAFT_530578 [Armillaria gallica]